MVAARPELWRARATAVNAMNDSWINGLRDELLALRGDAGVWGNRPAGSPYVEPTILATLALVASAAEHDAATRQIEITASDWLAGLQQADGALGISPHLPRPHWTTPLAVLAWCAAARQGEARRKAVEWLLSHQGDTTRPAGSSPMGHDPGIPGWPWVEGTHSWLEPTAMAVLALRRAGLADHPRTQDGQRLVRDRVIRTGGWNYGNSTVFGADLRPQPGPTGLALLALAGCDDFDSPCIARSCAYLSEILPTTHAPQSLCFGILALSAWERRPAESEQWLRAAVEPASKYSNVIAHLAHLLLAAGRRSLELLGLEPSAVPAGAPS